MSAAVFNMLSFAQKIDTIEEFFNPRSLLEKTISRSLEGGGGVNRTSPSTFNTIHLIDLKFGTYNKLHLYFQ